MQHDKREQHSKFYLEEPENNLWIKNTYLNARSGEHSVAKTAIPNGTDVFNCVAPAEPLGTSQFRLTEG